MLKENEDPPGQYFLKRLLGREVSKFISLLPRNLF